MVQLCKETETMLFKMDQSLDSQALAELDHQNSTEAKAESNDFKM